MQFIYLLIKKKLYLKKIRNLINHFIIIINCNSIINIISMIIIF